MGRRIGVIMPIPWETLGRCALACMAMAGAVLLVPAWGGTWELFVKAAVGAVVYGGVAWALNAAGVQDLAGRLIGARLTRRVTA
jgi:hypothetical protein